MSRSPRSVNIDELTVEVRLEEMFFSTELQPTPHNRVITANIDVKKIQQYFFIRYLCL